MTGSINFSLPGGPELSPRAALIEWLVAAGDRVARGDPLCRYEIDKAVATFDSPEDGFVRRLLIDPGKRFSRGDAMVILSDSRDGPLAGSPVALESDVEEEGDFDWCEIDNRGGDPEPLDIMRRAIAERMTMSRRHIPCFYLTSTVDMSGCLALRAEMKRNGRKATINDMVIKASALALERNPRAAAVYVPEGLVPRTDINIGFAAVLPDDGLVVPVVRKANTKPLADIADETRRLAEKAKKGRLEPADCSGGVFSVSYLGAYDVDNFVAIVNPGEAAIAAVGRTIETPVVIDGAVHIRPIVKITLSSDHRSIDGALAARVMGDMKRLLENPESL